MASFSQRLRGESMLQIQTDLPELPATEAENKARPERNRKRATNTSARQKEKNKLRALLRRKVNSAQKL